MMLGFGFFARASLGCTATLDARRTVAGNA